METLPFNKSTQRLLDMATELIDIFRIDLSLIPKEDYKSAQNLLSIFDNPEFSFRFQNLSGLKNQLYTKCLIDVAEGAKALKTGVFQIYFQNGQLLVGHRNFGESQSGELVYSVGLKNIVAFQGFKDRTSSDLQQTEINWLSLYFIYSMAFQ